MSWCMNGIEGFPGFFLFLSFCFLLFCFLLSSHLYYCRRDRAGETDFSLDGGIESGFGLMIEMRGRGAKGMGLLLLVVCGDGIFGGGVRSWVLR